MKTKKKLEGHLHRVVIVQVITLISTSFGLVAALAWSNIITALKGGAFTPTS